MAATHMLRKHQATVASAGKPEAVAERKIAREAHERAMADCNAAYPELTVENFEAADEYRRQRVDHWTRALSEQSDRQHHTHRPHGKGETR